MKAKQKAPKRLNAGRLVTKYLGKNQLTQSIRVVVQEAKYGRLASINAVSKNEL